MNGVQALSEKLGIGWMLVPIALLVGVNSVGSTAANQDCGRCRANWWIAIAAIRCSCCGFRMI